MKRWILKDINIDECLKFKEKNNLNYLLCKVIFSRCKDEKEAEHFLFLKEQLIDPLSIKDMDKAKDIILNAIRYNKRILVFGDYDADGVMSTAFLYNYLKSIYDNVYYYIPNRFTHGYGINKKSIDEILNIEIDLIITVDNGINAFEAIDYANSLGIDVIVTDHHIPSNDLPRAKAVVNPNRFDCESEFKFFAGVGVVFKLVCALCNNDYISVLDKYSYFITIGTISDLMPLIGENKFIVRYGLERFLDCENKGIVQFNTHLKLFDKDFVCSSDIAFLIAPRINAAGRIKNAYYALELFIDNNSDCKSSYLRLNELNDLRKRQEQETISKINEIILNNFEIINRDIIVIFVKDINEGIIGLIASNISLKYSKPTIIFTNSNDEDILKGSARSAKGFDIFSAIKNCEDLLIGFGGHKFAAGLSLSLNKLNIFIDRINNNYNRSGFDFEEIEIDCEVDIDDVCIENIESLFKLEPFGKKNREPVFIMKNLIIKNIISMGNDKHTRLILQSKNKSISVNWFKKSPSSIKYIIGDIIDIVFSMSINYYNSNKCPSFSLIDIRIANLSEHIFDECYMLDKIKKQMSLSEDEVIKILPDRQSISLVYTFLKDNFSSSSNLEKMFYKIGNKKIGYCKMVLSIMVLKELNLIYEVSQNGKILYKINKIEGKKDIENSNIIKNLKLTGRLK